MEEGRNHVYLLIQFLDFGLIGFQLVKLGQLFLDSEHFSRPGNGFYLIGKLQLTGEQNEGKDDELHFLSFKIK